MSHEVNEELNKYDVPVWLIEALKSYDGLMTTERTKGEKMKAKRSLAQLIKSHSEAYAAEKVKKSEDRHGLIVKKYKKLAAAIFAVKFYLDQPYPDDDRWTPYTRFVGPRMKMLEAAITKGEDIGDLEGIYRASNNKTPDKEK